MDMPLSEDALRFARKLAASKYTYPDDRLAVTDLLERWNLGLGSTLAERRMALRLSREAALSDERPRRRTRSPPCHLWPACWQPQTPAEDEEAAVVEVADPESGDDDSEDDLDEYAVSDFYADALDDA